jgi:cellulose synthase/poly-beta-1,6-N-acetylglucosamine synthase-like glycosyltransferase
MPLPLPGVSVIIACPNHAACLDECIEKLIAQEWEGELEVIVLPDEDFEKPSAYPDFVKIIPTGKLRPAEKRNIGIKEARFELLAFVDDDAAPLEGWLEHAIPYFSDETVVGVGGPALTPSTDSFLSAAGGRVYANIFVSGGYRRRYIPTRVCNDDDLPSCNLFVRKSAVEAIGGYDVRYWPGEDTQLCMALTENTGKRIVYDPWVQVIHHRRALFLPHLRQVSRYAKHRGHFARRGFSTSFRLCYMVPTAFVLGVILGGVVVAVAGLAWLTWIYAACCGLYLLLTFFSSFSFNPIMWVATWLGVIATHFAYGINFAYGWFAPGMETKVKSFDHYGDSATKSDNFNNDRNQD